MPKTYHTHGMKGTPTYTSWQMMIQRCTNLNNPKYESYGGRGITVCDEWRKDFRNFFRDMGERPDNKTIDRIDNNKGYYKENCRWSTARDQAYNQRPRKQREFCSKGHKLSEDNVYLSKRSGGYLRRLCRICELASVKARYAKSREAIKGETLNG